MLRMPKYLRPLLLLALLFVFGSAAGANSQTAAGPVSSHDLTGRWGLGLRTGMMKLVEGEWDYSTVESFGGLQLSKGLSAQWTLSLALQYGLLRPGAEFPGDEVGLSGTSSAPLYTSVLQPSLKLQHRFSAGAKVAPVLALGLGLTKWRVMNKVGEDVGWFPSGDAIDGFDTDGNATTLDGTDFTLLMELGLDVRLNESLRLNLGASYDIMPGNKKDNIGLSSYWGADNVDANTAMVEAMVGLTWWFGSSDSDHDGIRNKDDQCPDEPEDIDGYNDTDGCPDLDNDGDGINDDLDGCPNEPEDMDGYQDEDGCPDPDNDGDGIVDALDQCPDEAEDLDGFEDDDGCPELDNDQDGVLDAADNCPDTPTGVVVDEHGCPLAEEIPETLVLKGVSFRTGSAQLTPGSIGILAEVAASLRSWPEKKVEIRGHTDSTGNPESNRELSQRRAMSVRDSLIQMGIAPSRITAVGYGQEFPIAGNDTKEGRSQNRRVEVHVVD